MPAPAAPTVKNSLLGMKIKDIAGINATFAAIPALKKVYIVEATGHHYFHEHHAKEAAASKNEEGETVEGKVRTLAVGAKELEAPKEEAK
jgi:hypothetical protein